MTEISNAHTERAELLAASARRVLAGLPSLPGMGRIVLAVEALLDQVTAHAIELDHLHARLTEMERNQCQE